MPPVLVVHGDRKTQRALGRVITSGYGPAMLLDTIEAACAELAPGTVAVVGLAEAMAGDLGALVRDARAGGGDVILCGEQGPVEVLKLVRDHALTHVVTTDAVAAADELPLVLRIRASGGPLDGVGVERYLAHGAPLHQHVPISTHGRLGILAAVRDDLASLGISARHERHAALIADELLANAIHDAPSRAGTVHRGSVRDPDRPLSARERPRLRWGADGRTLAIEVTDQFGNLDGETIRAHLAKLVDRSTKPREGNGGAGLGLAMAYTAASQLVFHLCPGRMTQAIGLIDLRSRPDGVRSAVPSLHVFIET